MSYKVSGIIHVMDEVKQITEKFKKQEIVLKQEKSVGNSEWTEFIKLQATQERCDKLRSFSAGDQVEVSFDLRGREWLDPATNETKYFTNLDLWDIEIDNKADVVDEDIKSHDSVEEGLPF